MLADRTHPLLLLPQIQQFPSALERALHFHAEPSLEVRLARWGERICCSFHFDMPGDWDPAGANQDTILAVNFAVKDPMPAADGAVVLGFYPAAACAWVSALCPAPKCLKDGMVSGSKAVLTGAVLLVVRPAANDWVEQLDEPSSACLPIAFDDCSYFRQQALDALLRWRG